MCLKNYPPQSPKKINRRWQSEKPSYGIADRCKTFSSSVAYPRLVNTLHYNLTELFKTWPVVATILAVDSAQPANQQDAGVN